MKIIWNENWIRRDKKYLGDFKKNKLALEGILPRDIMFHNKFFGAANHTKLNIKTKVLEAL